MPTNTKALQVAEPACIVAGKNAVINGGFDIWQRGTSFAADLTYSADRWLFNRSGGVGGSTVSRSTDVPTGFQYSMKNQRDNGQTGTAALNGYYNIETVNSIPFAGQTVTLSFYAKKGANYSGGNFSITLTSGTGTDQRVYSYTGAATVATTTTISLSTSWTRYSITGAVASNATELGITTAWTPTGTAGADDSVYMTGFQLELGNTATPFSRAGGTIQGELAACQRYYFRYASSQYLGVGHLQSTTAADFYIKTPVTMRTAPTYAAASGTNYFQVGSAGATTSYSTIGNFYGSGTDGVLGRITVSGFTAGQGCAVVMASASAWVEGSAEL